MASRKELKKEINNVINNVVEEAYSYYLYNPTKKEKEVNAIIDDSIDVLDDLLEKVNSARNLKSGKDIRSHFAQVRKELDEKSEQLYVAINKLG